MFTIIIINIKIYNSCIVFNVSLYIAFSAIHIAIVQYQNVIKNIYIINFIGSSKIIYLKRNLIFIVTP